MKESYESVRMSLEVTAAQAATVQRLNEEFPEGQLYLGSTVRLDGTPTVEGECGYWYVMYLGEGFLRSYTINPDGDFITSEDILSGHIHPE